MAYKKNPILIYNRIDNLRIFRNSADSNKESIDLINNIVELSNDDIKNKLLSKIINKIISYYNINLINYLKNDIIKLNSLYYNSPLKYCCYSDKYSSYNIKIVENIKEVIIFLLEECNLSIMEIYENNNYMETIFDMLNNNGNTISPLIKQNIYEFLIFDCKNNILRDFNNMIFNLKNREIILQYQNKMMFIICNYNKETYEIIIKFLSSDNIINDISFIVKTIFSEKYGYKCNFKEYEFCKNYENIVDLMIKNIEQYIDKINICNLLNFIWTLYEINYLKDKINKILKIIICKYIIIKIQKNILNNTIENSNDGIDFILSLDIRSTLLLTNYLKLTNIVF